MSWKLTVHPHNTLHQPIVVHYHLREHLQLQKHMRGRCKLKWPTLDSKITSKKSIDLFFRIPMIDGQI